MVMNMKKDAYVEIVSEITCWSIKLTLWDRFCIGRAGGFTRENVGHRIGKRIQPLDFGFGVMDFHAVCGDIDIPWATKEGFECYTAHLANKPFYPSWLTTKECQ
jgi:hypothetical protein